MSHDHKDKDKRGFIAGALFGTILGGLAALLLAPKSGKETQADIKKKAKQVAHTHDAKLDAMESELNSRIDTLKVAARDLRGEAYDESQRLITRAEILKDDLQASASRLAGHGKVAGKEASADAKRLVSEGQVVMDELVRATKRLMNSAKDKSTKDKDGGRED